MLLVAVLAPTASAQSPAGGPHILADAPQLPYHLPPDTYAKAVALGRIRTGLHFGSELWELTVLLVFVATGRASRLGTWVELKTHRCWLQSLLFGVLVSGGLYLFTQVPVAAIGHSIALRYNISVEPWLLWLADQSKALGLIAAIETPLLMLAFWLLRWSPRRYWLWFAAAMVPLSILAVVLLPAVVEPLFNDFEPLSQSHPKLVHDLQRVVVRTGTSIPPERMFLMKASEKSNGLNAYVTGLGPSKRIVVWDTTADRMPEDEVLFTFAHESGHYVLHHILKGLAIGAFGLFFFFGAAAWLSERSIACWGRSWRVQNIATFPGLTVLLLACSLLQSITEPLPNTVSRYIEHEADVYGQEAVHGIVADPQKTAVAAFNKLGEASLDDPTSHPLLEFWMEDHPSIQNRAIFAAHYDPWVPGQSPKFFPR